jgi:ribose transport system permease protein
MEGLRFLRSGAERGLVFKNAKSKSEKGEIMVRKKERLANVNITKNYKVRVFGQARNPIVTRRVADMRVVRYLPFIVVIAILIILWLTVPYFLTISNIINILTQASALGLMAIGISVVLIGGGIDLSIPSLMALGGVFGAIFLKNGGNPVLAGLIMLAVCILGGCINGFAVGYLKMVPFIVTFSMMTVAMGAALWVTKAVSVGGLPQVFIDTVLAKIWGIPVVVIALIIIAAVATLLMRKSLYGRWLYSVGINVEASRVAGIPIKRVIFSTYVISGLFAGLAAIIITARLGAGAATIGREGVILDVISSAVVGGVSILGGVGSALGAVIGAIIITLISNVMNMMHVSYYLTLVAKGFIVIAIVAISSFRMK